MAASLISVTIIGIKVYEKAKERIRRYERCIPKISGSVLLALAIGLLIGVI